MTPVRALPLSLMSGLAVLVAGSAGCGSDDGETIADHCNPLGGERCLLPFPSNVYLTEDDSTETGYRLDIPPGALPTNIDGIPIEPDVYNRADGFSPTAPIVVAFATGVDPAPLPTWMDYDASLAPGSPTILIDMQTGDKVAHFAEVDSRADDPTTQALYIRPARLLEGGRRYAVGIRSTLKAADGSELPVADAFQAARDGGSYDHPRFERIRQSYDDIAGAFSEHGIAADELVLAWDFTTASRSYLRADMIAARDRGLAMVAADPDAFGYEITSDQVPDDARFVRHIEGELDVPLFLSEGGAFTSTSRLLRDSDGLPAPDGSYRIEFTAMVPACALEAAEPVPMMIYGHGLLGASNQVASGGPRTAAAELCMVSFGTDLRGMSDYDVPNVILALNDANLGPLIFDTLIQGIVNHIVLVELARTVMADQLFVDGDGISLVDPDTVHYYGISQGGIFGATIAAYDPVIDQAVLQVGAMNYSMMLDRSRDWPTYRTVLIGAYPHSVDLAILLHLLQSQWDRTDPASVADGMLTGDIPGAGPTQVLLQMAVADDEVSNLATEYQARSMNIPVLAPTVYTPWGVSAATEPVPSGLALFDYGLGETIPVGNQPPPDNEVHGLVRKQEAAIEMMRRFLVDGEAVQTCGSEGCVCHEGGCGGELP